MKLSEKSIYNYKGKPLFPLENLADVIESIESNGNAVLSIDIFSKNTSLDGPLYTPSGENIRLTGTGFHNSVKISNFIQSIRQDFPGTDVAIMLNTKQSFE